MAAGLNADSGWSLAAATLVIAGLLLVPGWVIGRSARLGALPSLAVAPAIGSALIGAAEILTRALALTWRPSGWAVIAALSVSSTLLMHLVAGPAAGPECQRMPWSRAERMILAGGLTVAVVVPAGVILSSLPGPGYPAQAFDATFHLNAVAAIREGGNASMLGGLSSLYSGRAIYYPTVWHGAVALAPGGPVPASTAGILALTAVIWPLSLLGLLARVTGLDSASDSVGDGADRRQQVCSVAAVLALSAGLVGFPLLLMTSLAVWPYALSVLGLPGALVLYDQLREGAVSKRLHLTWVLLMLAVAGGVVAAHGTGLFNLAILTLPFLADVVASLWRRSAGRRGGQALLVAGAAGTLLVLATGAWLMRGSLASVLGYERPAGGVAGAVATLGQALVDLPMYGSVPGATVPIGVVFGLLTLVPAEGPNPPSGHPARSDPRGPGRCRAARATTVGGAAPDDLATGRSTAGADGGRHDGRARAPAGGGASPRGARPRRLRLRSAAHSVRDPAHRGRHHTHSALPEPAARRRRRPGGAVARSHLLVVPGWGARRLPDARRGCTGHPGGRPRLGLARPGAEGLPDLRTPQPAGRALLLQQLGCDGLGLGHWRRPPAVGCEPDPGPHRGARAHRLRGQHLPVAHHGLRLIRLTVP